MRERLIELLNDVQDYGFVRPTEEEPSCNVINPIVADYLLANGVIVPPCPIGTKIYMLVTKKPKQNFPEFTFIKDSKLTFLNLERVIAQFGKTVFLTKEEAENALKARERE